MYALIASPGLLPSAAQPNHLSLPWQKTRIIEASAPGPEVPPSHPKDMSRVLTFAHATFPEPLNLLFSSLLTIRVGHVWLTTADITMSSTCV